MFLSYARGDRVVAERLAGAIADAGLSVWWDRHIKGGAEFSSDIEQQLEAATRVLVLWSKEAVVSRWVRDEASFAADSKRLVSATIDGTPPPLGFRQFQTIDLKAWAAKGAAIPADLAEALEIEAPVPAASARSAPPRRKLIAAGVAALLLAGAATVAIVRPAPFDRLLSGDSESEGLSLAIMPFAIESGGEDDYLGAGLSRALADSLAPLSGLRITASTSTQAISQKGLTVPEIGKRLGISHLVEGNVQRGGAGYAISIRLIEAATSEQIWARSFEGSAGDLQEIKSRMARELAGALQARLGVGPGELADRGKVDPRAYEAYLRALERVSVREDREARAEAIKQFRLAASIEPDFADAHAGHAYLLALSMPDQLGMAWPQLMAEQRKATARALELDPDNDLALIAKAVALHNFDGDADRAWAIGQEVLKRSPNFGPAHYNAAASLWMRGQGREAIHHLDQAIDQNPFEAITRFYRIQILYSLGEYEPVKDAVKQCPPPCLAAGWFWLLAMAGYATPAEMRRDLPDLMERAAADGVQPEFLAEDEKIIQAFVLGRHFVPTPLEADSDAQFSDAALHARLGSFDLGLRYARSALERRHPDAVLEILNTGRVTFTPEQRADPRYHQLFRHPKLTNIVSARRKNGVTAGLPIFPVKPYTGR